MAISRILKGELAKRDTIFKVRGPIMAALQSCGLLQDIPADHAKIKFIVSLSRRNMEVLEARLQTLTADQFKFKLQKKYPTTIFDTDRIKADPNGYLLECLSYDPLAREPEGGPMCPEFPKVPGLLEPACAKKRGIKISLLSHQGKLVLSISAHRHMDSQINDSILLQAHF